MKNLGSQLGSSAWMKNIRSVGVLTWHPDVAFLTWHP